MKKHNETLVNLLTTQWGNDTGMISFVLKNHSYIELNDGFMCTNSNNAPAIESTIYYSDEYERPVINEENFINDNLKFYFYDSRIQALKNSENKFYLTPEWDNNKTGQLFDYTQHSEIKPSHLTLIRELTTNEKQQIIDSLLKSKEKYTKRLKSYFKRYRHKIYARSYYADR